VLAQFHELVEALEPKDPAELRAEHARIMAGE
jgi:hypothetical protein